jgi:protoporphyrinogen oxidase
MKDSAPYGAVVSHTNFVPVDRYGEHLVYLASYFSGTVPPNIDQVMIGDFRTRFSVAPSEIRWHRVAVDPFAGPVYVTGYKSMIPPYRQQGLLMAGMFSRANYPERSMEGSIRAGKDVAACIRLESKNDRT